MFFKAGVNINKFLNVIDIINVMPVANNIFIACFRILIFILKRIITQKSEIIKPVK